MRSNMAAVILPLSLFSHTRPKITPRLNLNNEKLGQVILKNGSQCPPAQLVLPENKPKNVFLQILQSPSLVIFLNNMIPPFHLSYLANHFKPGHIIIPNTATYLCRTNISIMVDSSESVLGARGLWEGGGQHTPGH